MFVLHVKVDTMNAIIELIFLIIGFIFFFLVRKNVEEETNQILEKNIKNNIKIYCEKIDDVHYAWLMPNNEFIGQSKHPNELAKLLMKKFPSKDYNLIIEEKT